MGKGVSAAEKRTRLLAHFHKETEVYTSKEILKAGGKLMPSGAVEGVLYALRDDDLVHEGKVGVSTYYWSFPGEAGTKKRNMVRAAQQNGARQQQQIASLEEQTAAMLKSQGGSEADAAAVSAAEASIAELKEREAAARAEIARLKNSAGENVHARKKDLPLLRDAANRWTDNLWELKKYLVGKGLDPAMIDQHLKTHKIDYVA